MIRLWLALADLPRRVLTALDPYSEYDRHRYELSLLARGILIRRQWFP